MTESCEKCGGTGWVTVKKNGESFAKKCDCRRQVQKINRNERANLPRRFWNFDLSTYCFDERQYHQTQIRAKKIADRFIKDYPAVTGGLLFQGTVGTGKTKLMCAIATMLMERYEDLDVYYIDWNDLVREMRSGQDSHVRDFEAINNLINRLTDVDLLLFDEIGASRVSPWVHDYIYYLINKRYNNRLVTICATNFSDSADSSGMETLTQRVGDRIRSRLFEMTEIVPVQGLDSRLKNQGQG